MTVRYHRELIQGSDEWLAARCGLLTASEMKLIITPTLKTASNEKERSHIAELAAQRITRYVEPHYIGDDMLRGQEDEIEAVILYNKHFGIVDQVGFITNDRWGFTLGYSPDGLVGADGLVECKSRRQKFQVQTIADAEIPDEFLIQLQTGLLVSERQWIDFISYSGGMPMAVMRAYPDESVQFAIVDAAAGAEARIAAKIADYNDALASDARLIPTERKVYEDLHA